MRWVKLLVISGTATLALLLLYPFILQLTGNFHEVVPGELYRSAQPMKGSITDYAQRYGIKTVINLRGDNPGEGWYDGEVAEAKAAGVEHMDFRMSSKRVLPTERVRELIALMKDAEKPLLIHCRNGTERTGLASALYVAGEGLGRQAAEDQLTSLYGRIWFISTPAMDDTFKIMGPELGFLDS